MLRESGRQVSEVAVLLDVIPTDKMVEDELTTP